MATEYFVVVSRLDDLKPCIKLCGRLWATHHSKADIEAGKYREELNEGQPLEVLLGKFYNVTSVPYSIARAYRQFDKFKNNRVTPKPSA